MCDARGTKRKTVKLSLGGQDFISIRKGCIKMPVACGILIREFKISVGMKKKNDIVL